MFDILLELCSVQSVVYGGLQKKVGEAVAGIVMENLCGLYKADTKTVERAITLTNGYLKSVIDAKNQEKAKGANKDD